MKEIDMQGIDHFNKIYKMNQILHKRIFLFFLFFFIQREVTRNNWSIALMIKQRTGNQEFILN
jgi:hypothetical protein